MAGFDNLIPDRPKQVHVGDVARQAIERLTAKEDALRELLSYFEAQINDEDATFYGAMYSAPAYRDAASKLRAILDGE